MGGEMTRVKQMTAVLKWSDELEAEIRQARPSSSFSLLLSNLELSDAKVYEP